jgi:hypothetical protein
VLDELKKDLALKHINQHELNLMKSCFLAGICRSSRVLDGIQALGGKEA